MPGPYDIIFNDPNVLKAQQSTNPFNSILGQSSSTSSNPFQTYLSQGAFQKRQNLYYRNKEINIDGYTFENCRFDNCKLITSKGNFKFINCVIDDSTLVHYVDPALKIIKLYNRRDQQKNPSISPIINSDGTITIN